MLALQTDSTRAVTVQIPWEGFKEPGLSGNYRPFPSWPEEGENRKLLKLEHAIIKRINTSLNVMRERQSEMVLYLIKQPHSLPLLWERELIILMTCHTSGR